MISCYMYLKILCALEQVFVKSRTIFLKKNLTTDILALPGCQIYSAVRNQWLLLLESMHLGKQREQQRSSCGPTAS